MKLRLSSYLVIAGSLLAAPGAALAIPYETLRSSGAARNRVDYVIVAEGYTAAELPKFRSDATALVSSVFAQEPYKRYQNYFNVHILMAASPQSGADHPERGVSVRTAFDATYNCSGIQRLICANVAKVQSAVDASFPSSAYYDQIVVLVNDAEYGGSGGRIAVGSTHAQAVELFLHEVGHSFAHLADEYTANPELCDTSEPAEANATSRLARSALKWRLWVNAETSLPTAAAAGVPGLFAGARYCPSGLYRPTSDSKMRTLGKPFGPINTEQHVRRIYNVMSPIDATQPAGAAVSVGIGKIVAFRVTTPSPVGEALVVRWFVDNRLVGSGPFISSKLIPAGTHTVRVIVKDPTPMVRNDPRQLLVESRSWTVSK